MPLVSGLKNMVQNSGILLSLLINEQIGTKNSSRMPRNSNRGSNKRLFCMWLQGGTEILKRRAIVLNLIISLTSTLATGSHLAPIS